MMLNIKTEQIVLVALLITLAASNECSLKLYTEDMDNYGEVAYGFIQGLY